MRIFSLSVARVLVAAVAAAQTPATPAPAAAQPAVFPAEARFAFVNLQFVIGESKAGKAGLAEFKKIQESRDAQLQLLAKEIAALQEKLGTTQLVLSADALRSLQNQIADKQRRLQFDSDSRDADLQRLSREIMDGLGAKVIPIVDGLRKEKGLWAIFGVRQDPGGLDLVSVDPALDLSAEVIKRLDASTGVK
jgi:Skp family chaperone for outer membrane proteins